jgi:hypothetical protein
VGELVNENDGGGAAQRRIKIEFLQDGAAIFNVPARQHFQSFEERFCLSTAVRLGKTDNDIDTFSPLLPGSFEHGIGLSDAGRRAEKYLQLPLAFSRFLLAGLLEKLIGIRSSFFHKCAPWMPTALLYLFSHIFRWLG